MTKLEYTLITGLVVVLVAWYMDSFAYRHPKTCPVLNGNAHISMEVNVDGSYRCSYQKAMVGMAIVRK